MDSEINFCDLIQMIQRKKHTFQLKIKYLTWYKYYLLALRKSMKRPYFSRANCVTVTT